jgi:hypothetical protein
MFINTCGLYHEKVSRNHFITDPTQAPNPWQKLPDTCRDLVYQWNCAVEHSANVQLATSDIGSAGSKRGQGACVMGLYYYRHKAQQ